MADKRGNHRFLLSGLLLLLLAYGFGKLEAAAQRLNKPSAKVPYQSRESSRPQQNDTSDQDYGRPSEQESDRSHGQSNSSVGLGVAVDLGSLFGGGGKDPAKELASKGPAFPSTFSMSTLTVQAFVKGDWPMVLDYEMDPGGIGLLTITSEGVEPFFYRLKGGKQQEILRLPSRFGDKPKVAWYSVRAMTDGAGEMKPVYLRIFGLGAGERAVGSVGIDQLRFRPARIRPDFKEKAIYGFHSRSDFNKVSAEFLNVGLMKGQVVANLVDLEKLGDVRRDETVTDKSWDGKGGKVNKELKGKPAVGQNMLQVRAWMGSKRAGDWVIAVSGVGTG